MFKFNLTNKVGYITEDDVKTLSKSQKVLIDQIIDNGACPAGKLPHEDVHSLYLQVRYVCFFDKKFFFTFTGFDIS